MVQTSEFEVREELLNSKFSELVRPVVCTAVMSEKTELQVTMNECIRVRVALSQLRN